MSSPIAPNDALREVMPRSEPTHAGADLARIARGTDFANLLKQTFAPPSNGPSPAGDQPSLNGASLSRETITAMDGDHASAAEPRSDCPENTPDERGAASPEGSPSPQSPVVSPAPQPHTPAQVRYAPAPEIALAGITEPGPPNPITASPIALPLNIGTATPADIDAASAAPAPPSFAGLLASRPQPSTTEPKRDDAPTNTRSAVPTPASVLPTASPAPSPVAASTEQSSERAALMIGPDTRPAPQSPMAPAPTTAVSSANPTLPATPAPLPSSVNANPGTPRDSRSDASPAALPVSESRSGAVQSNVSPPVAVAADIVVNDAVVPAVVPEGMATEVASDEPLQTPREVATRSPSHPAAAFTAQLAQQTEDPAPRSLAPSPVPSDAQPRPGTFEPAADTSTTPADESGTTAATSPSTGLNDPGTTRPNASTGPDQVAARTMRVAAHPAIAQVAVVVTKAAQDGVDRITIKLQPPELGRIDVRLDVSVDGRIQAVFAAERSSTVDILQRDVRELERALQSAGLSADPGGLSFGLKQQSSQGMPRFGAPLTQAEIGLTDGETAVAAFAAAAARAAADGRLDIQV